jgi:hypothetical protein
MKNIFSRAFVAAGYEILAIKRGAKILLRIAPGIGRSAREFGHACAGTDHHIRVLLLAKPWSYYAVRDLQGFHTSDRPKLGDGPAQGANGFGASAQ